MKSNSSNVLDQFFRDILRIKLCSKTELQWRLLFDVLAQHLKNYKRFNVLFIRAHLNCNGKIIIKDKLNFGVQQLFKILNQKEFRTEQITNSF